MKGLVIGDPASIELRDKGREDAERLTEEEFLERLQEKVECPDCPYDSSFTDTCEGPDMVEQSGSQVTWKCPTEECPCCESLTGPSNFITDLDGHVLKGKTA